ncbi:hypothetical protein ACFL6C_05485 [Myxococcota bacterium]
MATPSRDCRRPRAGLCLVGCLNALVVGSCGEGDTKVAGRVVDLMGQPVEGATVHVEYTYEREEDNCPHRMTSRRCLLTDADGRYGIVLADDPMVAVTVTKADFIGQVSYSGSDFILPRYEPAGQFVSVATHYSIATHYQRRVCAVREDDSIVCWGSGHDPWSLGHDPWSSHYDPWGLEGEQFVSPSGSFVSVKGGLGFCALGVDSSVACWGREDSGNPARPITADAPYSPPGSYVAIADACGINTSGEISCWLDGASPGGSVPSGQFIAMSGNANHGCGIRPNNTVECWGNPPSPNAGLQFIAVSVNQFGACGITLGSGAISCWDGAAYAPSGEFSSISVGDMQACAIRSDDNTVRCWGEMSAPEGTFQQVSADVPFAYGIRTDGTLALPFAYGIRTDGTLAFWGRRFGFDHECVEEDGSWQPEEEHNDCW